MTHDIIICIKANYHYNFLESLPKTLQISIQLVMCLELPSRHIMTVSVKFLRRLTQRIEQNKYTCIISRGYSRCKWGKAWINQCQLIYNYFVVQYLKLRYEFCMSQIEGILLSQGLKESSMGFVVYLRHNYPIGMWQFLQQNLHLLQLCQHYQNHDFSKAKQIQLLSWRHPQSTVVSLCMKLDFFSNPDANCHHNTKQQVWSSSQICFLSYQLLIYPFLRDLFPKESIESYPIMFYFFYSSPQLQKRYHILNITLHLQSILEIYSFMTLDESKRMVMFHLSILPQGQLYL